MLNLLKDTSLYTLILVLLLSGSELLSQFFLKHSVHNKSNISFIIGILMYGFAGYLFWKSLHYKSFGVMGVLWHVTMTVLTIAISIFYFQDKYTTSDVIGMILGIVSMVLLLQSHSH